MQPNVLLIVFDTARADALEPFGATRGATPVVADLARRGSAFPRVYATANWTLPSHGSMFTGLLPRPLGYGAVDPRTALRHHQQRLLPAVLQKHGYATAGVSANPMIARAFGFDIGFERFVSVPHRRHVPGVGLRKRIRWTLDAVRSRLDDGLAAISAQLDRWLEDSPVRPFFWFVNLMECHSPYLPPQPWNDYGVIKRYLAGEDARRYQTHDGMIRFCIDEIDVPAASLERMRHLYNRSVSSMDWWLGRLLSALESKGLLEETLVIVTSDHGENLGEGHLLGHAISLDERLIHVPLVAAGPGAPREDGRVMSLMELPRLVAAAAGLDDHPWQDTAGTTGIAVAQSDGLETVSKNRFVAAMRLPPRAQEAMSLRRSCATDGRFKLVREGDTTRLHDLESDPLERVDAAPTFPDQVARLRRVLDGYDSSSETAAVPPEDGAEAGTDASGATRDAESAELEERLKLLGYL